MRTFAMVYCVLTLIFVGGCAILVLRVGEPSLLDTAPGQILALATAGNAILALLLKMRASARALITAGSVYAAAQCWLAWRGEIWGEFGPLAVFVFTLFVFKGVVLVFAGLEKQDPAPPANPA